jgi:hypothetical protein
MRFISIIVFVFSVLSFNQLKGQDTITLLSGKVINVEILDTDSFAISYNYKKKNKTKQKTIAADLVFDIAYQNGTIDTIYKRDPSIDQYLTVEEMQFFIWGEQDALKYYKATLTTVFGVAFGAGFGYLLHDGFYVAGVPLVYTVGAGVSKITIRNGEYRSSTILSNPAYQEGYIKVARSKKAFNALASSTLGTLIGVLVGNATR